MPADIIQTSWKNENSLSTTKKEEGRAATMEERYECKECKKVFTKKKQYTLHMKSMQHAYRLEFLNDRKQEKEEYFRLESESRDRKAELMRRALPIVERFHTKMYLLMKQEEDKNEKEKENNQETEKEDNNNDDPWPALTKSINDHYASSRPRELIRKRRRCLFALVKEITAEFFPEAKLEVYGSIPLHLDAENSDIDVSIMLKEGTGWGGASGHEHALSVLNTIGDAIDFCGSTHLQVTKILTARIPLITISDEGLSGLQLDLSLWMMDKLEINRVLVAYLAMDDRIKPLMKAVRVWSKSRDINDAYTGTVNSFAWTVMCLAFLLIEGIVPPIPQKIEDLEEMVAVFKEKNKSTASEGGSSEKKRKSVGQLFYEFFEFLLAFDYTNKRFSLRCGGITDKEAEKFTDDTVFVVERPRTPWQNMTRQVTLGSIKRLRYEWHRVVDLLKEGALVDDLCKREDKRK